MVVNDGFSIAALAVGNGGQVITFDPYTPIKPLNTANRSLNTIADRVSYSYPYKWTDGHFDSPFDFKKKMIIERESTKAYYTANVSASLPAGTTVGGTALTAFPNSTLQDYAQETAPQGVWGRYLDRNYTQGSGAGAIQNKAFMPGLGLLKYDKANAAWDPSGNFNSSFDRDLVSGSFPTISGDARSVETNTEPYPAGTDCLGMVQRAASYSGERYTWGNIVTGWAEGGALSPGHGGRTYPRARLASGGADANFEEPYAVTSNEIFRREGINFDILVESATEHIDKQHELSKIVPGDVFYWRLASGSMHIALVNKVIWGDDGRVIDIVLIEATFGINGTLPYAQAVINNRSLSQFYPVGSTYEHYHIVRLQH